MNTSPPEIDLREILLNRMNNSVECGEQPNADILLEVKDDIPIPKADPVQIKQVING